jgi:hypothetical protein
MKKKIKKRIKKFFKEFSPYVVLFGLLSGLGVMVLSVLFANLPGQEFEKYSLILHPLFSLGFFFLIGRVKDFKLGYIIGVVLTYILLLRAYVF